MSKNFGAPNCSLKWAVSHSKNVKLWFRTVFYVSFNSVSNLIVILFNYFFVFLWALMWGLYLRVWWRFCEEEDFATSSWLSTCVIGYGRSTYWNLKSFWQARFCESFATQAKSWLTHETLCLISLVVSFHIPLPILYKPSLSIL